MDYHRMVDYNKPVTSLSILVIGCGSIGMRHIANLAVREGIDISAFSAPERIKLAEEQYGVKPFFNLDDALDGHPDAVFICNETSKHLETAMKSLRAGCHLFIEKPISHSLDGVEELISLAESTNKNIMVGYNLRFHPAVKKTRKELMAGKIGKPLNVCVEMGQYLPTWRKGRDYKSTYTAYANMGGGIILDMSHEIDYLIWYFGLPIEVACFADHLSTLEVQAEDIAALIVRFKTGVIGEIHLDFIQRRYVRGGKIIGNDGAIRWQFFPPKVEILINGKPWKLIMMKDDYNSNQMYIDAAENFIQSIQSGQKPGINGVDGLNALRVALAAHQSTKYRKIISL